jgi:malonyl-CoA/methylmalonyl-CoA synthetase
VHASPLVERFRRVAKEHAARVALEDDAGTLTFGELAERVEDAAHALEALGLGGTRIGLFASPGRDFAIAFFAAIACGGTAVALSPLHPATELAWFVAASRASALLVSGELTDAARAFAGNVPLVDIAAREAGRPRADGGTLGSGVAPPSAFAAPPNAGVAATRASVRERPEADDVALLLFTSGTTGKPKAARLTHENLERIASTLGDAWRMTPDDVLLHVLPLHHLHGIAVSFLVAVLTGARTRFLPRFDAERVWDELGRASVLMGVPTQHKKLFDAFDVASAERRARWTHHARGLRLVTSGSAALSPVLGERWRALAGQYPLERYGMTEIGIVLSNPCDGERRPGTVGRALPGIDLRVVRDDGSDAAPDEAGEIWVRGPTVFAGYDGMACDEAAGFCDGWFRTGDTAQRSADGYVKILGRTSVDILKSGGYKLSALEIEDVLREHPAVSDVAVVGVPDDTWGEIVVAAVVPRAGRSEELDETALRAWARERLAAYELPKRVVLCDELPRNALGKVTKSELRSQVRRRLA